MSLNCWEKRGSAITQVRKISILDCGEAHREEKRGTAMIQIEGGLGSVFLLCNRARRAAALFVEQTTVSIKNHTL